MPHFTIAFSSKHASMISWLIRRVQRWRHSHVVLVNPEGTMFIESTGDEWIDAAGKIRNGVRVRPISFLLEERDDIEFRTIAHPSGDRVWLEALKYQDKQYDHTYLWSAFFGRDEQNESQMSCPELIRQASIDAGFDPLPESVKIETVRDFYMISNPTPQGD